MLINTTRTCQRHVGCCPVGVLITEAAIVAEAAGDQPVYGWSEYPYRCAQDIVRVLFVVAERGVVYLLLIQLIARCLRLPLRD